MTNMRKRCCKIAAMAVMIIVMLCGSVFLLGSVMTVSAWGDPDNDFQKIRDLIDDEEIEGQPTYSLYNISLVLGKYLNDATAPSNDEGGRPSGIKPLDTVSSSDGDAWTQTSDPLPSDDKAGYIQAGDAGAFVVYAEQGWLASLLSSSSTSYSYDTFNKIAVDKSGDEIGGYTTLLHDYVQYGYVLGELGLDQSTTEMSFAFVDWIIGAPMMLLYMLSLGIPYAFGVVVTILQMVNPFFFLLPSGESNKFTMMTFDDNGNRNATRDKVITIGPDDGSLFAGLRDRLSGWYDSFSDFSWQIIVPICFLMLVVSALLLRRSWQQNGTSKIKNYIVRLIFLVVGIPICGGCYTFALNELSNALDMDNSASTRVVAATLVDFESWAANGRLSPPKTTSIKIDTSSKGSSIKGPSGESILNARAIAYEINKAYSYDWLNGQPPFGNVKNLEDVGQWNNANKGLSGDSDDVAGGNDCVSHTLDILTRYMKSSFYYGSDYESMVKGQLTFMARKDKYSGFIHDLFMTSEYIGCFYASTGKSPELAIERHVGRQRFRNMTDYFMDTADEIRSNGISYSGDESEDGDYGTYPIQEMLAGAELAANGNGKKEREAKYYDRMPNIFANGALILNGDTYAEGKSDASVVDLDFNSASPEYGNRSDLERGCDMLVRERGLSTMAMFNYLNTSFDDDSLTVFSSAKASSGFVRKGHRSVTLVGTGVRALIYYFNSLVILGVVAILGYFYAMAIIFGNLKRGIHLIGSVPFALLGSVRSIARVITYTLIMIIEIVATVFLYLFMSDLILSVSDMIESPFAALLSSPDKGGEWLGDTVAIGPGAATIVVTLSGVMSMIAYIVMFIMALRFRKKVVKSLDELAASWVDKFLNTNSGAVAGHGPGLASKAAGALAAGAGAAAGNKLMNSMMGGNTKNPTASESPESSTDKDPKANDDGGGSKGDSGSKGSSGSDSGSGDKGSGSKLEGQGDTKALPGSKSVDMPDGNKGNGMSDSDGERAGFGNDGEESSRSADEALAEQTAENGTVDASAADGDTDGKSTDADANANADGDSGADSAKDPSADEDGAQNIDGEATDGADSGDGADAQSSTKNPSSSGGGSAKSGKSSSSGSKNGGKNSSEAKKVKAVKSGSGAGGSKNGKSGAGSSSGKNGGKENAGAKQPKPLVPAGTAAKTAGTAAGAAAKAAGAAAKAESAYDAAAIKAVAAAASTTGSVAGTAANATGKAGGKSLQPKGAAADSQSVSASSQTTSTAASVSDASGEQQVSGAVENTTGVSSPQSDNSVMNFANNESGGEQIDGFVDNGADMGDIYADDYQADSSYDSEVGGGYSTAGSSGGGVSYVQPSAGGSSSVRQQPVRSGANVRTGAGTGTRQQQPVRTHNINTGANSQLRQQSVRMHNMNSTVSSQPKQGQSVQQGQRQSVQPKQQQRQQQVRSGNTNVNTSPKPKQGQPVKQKSAQQRQQQSVQPKQQQKQQQGQRQQSVHNNANVSPEQIKSERNQAYINKLENNAGELARNSAKIADNAAKMAENAAKFTDPNAEAIRMGTQVAMNELMASRDRNDDNDSRL